MELEKSQSHIPKRHLIDSNDTGTVLGADSDTTAYRKSPLLRRWFWIAIGGLFLTPFVSSAGYIAANFPQVSAQVPAMLWTTVVPPRLDISTLLGILAVLATIVVAMAFQRTDEGVAAEELIDRLDSRETLLATNAAIGITATVLTLGFAWGRLMDLWIHPDGLSRFWEMLGIVAAGQAITIASIATTTLRSERAVLAKAQLPRLESRQEKLSRVCTNRWGTSPLNVCNRMEITLAWALGIFYVIMVVAVGTFVITNTYPPSSGVVDGFLQWLFVAAMVVGFVGFLGIQTATSVNGWGRGFTLTCQLALLLIPSLGLGYFALVQPMHSPFWWSLLGSHLVLVLPVTSWRYPKQRVLRAVVKYSGWHMHVLRQSFVRTEYRARESAIRWKRQLVEEREKEQEQEAAMVAERERRWLEELARALQPEPKASVWQRLNRLHP